MRVVTLVSGGLDSTVMSLIIASEGYAQVPLFIDYGQLNLDRELSACLANFERHALPTPRILRLPAFGKFFSSGITDSTKDILQDAFLPGRNLLFLLCAAALAHDENADAVAIGFLDESLSLFPDQRRDFADSAAQILSSVMRGPISILTPLIQMTKGEVLAMSRSFGVRETYSCHAGLERACGRCIACREYFGLEEV